LNFSAQPLQPRKVTLEYEEESARHPGWTRCDFCAALGLEKIFLRVPYHRLLPCHSSTAASPRHKVTIRPDFSGTVPFFSGLSQKNWEVSRDAHLSRFSHSVPDLSRVHALDQLRQRDNNPSHLIHKLQLQSSGSILVVFSRHTP